MTPEEAKALKKGDSIIIHAVMAEVPDNPQAIWCELGSNDKTCLCVALEDISVPAPAPAPAPKYDPTRLFKKGDIVKPCSVNGRWCSYVWEDRSGIHYEVTKDENPLTANMEVKDLDSLQPFLVHAAFFKLVTPVEETEPYSIIVQPEGYRCVRIMKGTKIHNSIPFDEEECVCRTLEEAKAAAEEERDRLNAEYRKEHSND